MKLPALIILSAISLTFFSCEKIETDYNPAYAYTVSDVAYGNDPKQKMDIYLPANRSSNTTKVFILIHGGAWSAGDKYDYLSTFNTLKTLYPDYAIANLNYRLGSWSDPGYPKQINDIQSAINELQLPEYDLSSQYFLFGSSAGGHLAMLYAYAFDPDHEVKGICNTVGPADLTDTAYTNNLIYAGMISALAGSQTYAQNPTLFEEVSPAKRVTPSSPKTISFYGSADPLIPSTQMGLLHSALDANGVYNESTMYPGEGHGGWSQANNTDAVTKTLSFINQFF